MVYGVGVRILIAEDERINQLYLSLVLSSAGHEVQVACDGERVLGCLTERSYDLIVMDMQMPQVDGFEAARRIRAGEAGPERARVPIVAISAYATRDDAARYAEAGIDRFAMKPVTEDRLLSIIEDLGLTDEGNA